MNAYLMRVLPASRLGMDNRVYRLDPPLPSVEYVIVCSTVNGRSTETVIYAADLDGYIVSQHELAQGTASHARALATLGYTLTKSNAHH